MKTNSVFYFKCAIILLALFGCFLVLIGLFSPIVNYPVMNESKFYSFYIKSSYILFILILVAVLIIISGRLYHLVFVGIIQIIAISHALFNFSEYIESIKNNFLLISFNINYFGWDILYLGSCILLITAIADIGLKFTEKFMPACSKIS